jgi:hypothetical protein
VVVNRKRKKYGKILKKRGFQGKGEKFLKKIKKVQKVGSKQLDLNFVS